MKLEITVSLPNSIVMIMDHESGKPPTNFHGKLIAFTDTCVAVGTVSRLDGKTKLQFSNFVDQKIIANKKLTFDGKVVVEGSHLSLVNAYNEKLLQLPVQAGRVGVQIWTNHPSEPDCIGFIVVDHTR